MKKIFYLVCVSASTLYANLDAVGESSNINTLRKELESIKNQQKELIKEDIESLERIGLAQSDEKLLEENAELLVNNEELLSQNKALKQSIETLRKTQCPEQKAPEHPPVKEMEPVLSQQVEEKSRPGILERAKEKARHLISSAKHIFSRS